MCETERDHGILAVGYCTECGTGEWYAIFLLSVSRQNVASCPILHRILLRLDLHRLYFHFQAQHHMRRLHTLLRTTGTVFSAKNVVM